MSAHVALLLYLSLPVVWFFKLPRWREMNDGRQSDFFSRRLLPLFREKVREDEVNSGCSSITEREWCTSEEVKVQEAWFSQGESHQEYTHTHAQRKKALIYLACQQLASMCSLLTPEQEFCYWSFSLHACTGCVRRCCFQSVCVHLSASVLRGSPIIYVCPCYELD